MGSDKMAICGMAIAPGKSERMEFLAQGPVRCKFVVDNKCIQQIKYFKYIDCEISYKNEKDI